jgi:xyloglucan-specific exo-beta-1,4-glucanase
VGYFGVLPTDIARRICEVKMNKMVKACILSCLLFSMLPAQLGAAAQTYRWGNLPMGGGGFVSAIVPSKTEPDLVYVRTDVGGAYRWDETNRQWIPLLDWVPEEHVGLFGVESLAIDPQNPDRVYMLAGLGYFNDGRTAILRSSDRGKTFALIDVTKQFKAHGNGIGRQNGERLQVDPNNSNVLYTGTRWNGLFRSADAGLTWTRLASLDVTTTPNENGVSFVLLDPGTAADGMTQRIFVGVSRFTSKGPNLFRSDDGGRSFTPVKNAPKEYMPQRAALAGDGKLYITYADGAGPHGHWSQPEPMEKGAVWKYNMADGRWTNITPPGFARGGFGGISVDPKNPNRLVLSTINMWLKQYGDVYGDRVLISTDGGANWTDVVARGFKPNANDVSWIEGKAVHWTGSIEFDPFNTRRVWVTSGNGVFRTENIDAGTTVWDFIVKGMEETVPHGMVSIPGGPLLSVVADYDGFRHTNIKEFGQIYVPSLGHTTGIDYARLIPDFVVRVGGKEKPGMYYSANMGKTWTRVAIKGTNGKVAVAADGSVILHGPEASRDLLRLTTQSKTWTPITGVNMQDPLPVADPVNPSKFYVYDTSGRMLVSTDGGASFNPAAALAGNGFKLIRLAPGREGDLWVPLGFGGLARSIDSGASFKPVMGVHYAGAVGFGKAAPGAKYPAVYLWGAVGKGVRGIYRSTDMGASWVRINDDAHQYGGPANGEFVLGDMNVFGRVYMSTVGRGIVYGEPVDSSAFTRLSSSPGSQLQ